MQADKVMFRLPGQRTGNSRTPLSSYPNARRPGAGPGSRLAAGSACFCLTPSDFYRFFPVRSLGCGQAGPCRSPWQLIIAAWSITNVYDKPLLMLAYRKNNSFSQRSSDERQ
jgi:hypothetical protein